MKAKIFSVGESGGDSRIFVAANTAPAFLGVKRRCSAVSQLQKRETRQVAGGNERGGPRATARLGRTVDGADNVRDWLHLPLRDHASKY
jgi:hypothetical protein